MPLQVIVNNLLDGDPPTEARLKKLLKTYYRVVLVTKEEDGMLRKAKLRSTMPKDWDERDPFARYRRVGIEIAE